MTSLAYPKAPEAREEPTEQIQRKRRNGNGEMLGAGEVSWWSLEYPLMTGPTEVKVVTIENTKEILETIAVSIEASWPDVALLPAVEGTQKWIEMAETEAPDVVILDLDLPGTDAFDTLREIRRFSDVLIIVLSKRSDEIRRVKVLVMGADEYISKPFSPIEFLARVGALLRRARTSEPKHACPSSFASNGLTINFLSREVSISGEPVKLTPIEYNLLTYLVKNEGRVIPRRNLMEKVWGSGYIDDYYLLKKYIYRLRQKLNDDGANPKMFIAERGVGYKFIRPKE